MTAEAAVANGHCCNGGSSSLPQAMQQQPMQVTMRRKRRSSNDGQQQQQRDNNNNNKKEEEEKRNGELHKMFVGNGNGTIIANGNVPTTSSGGGGNNNEAAEEAGQQQQQDAFGNDDGKETDGVENEEEVGNVGSGSSSKWNQQRENVEIRRFGRSTKSKLQRILPSTYLKLLLPPGFYRLCRYGAYLFWFIIGILVLRKTRTATAAVRYVKTHGPSVSLASIEDSAEFAALLKQMDAGDDATNIRRRPPAILMLNQYALNMTFNFLCNTAIFPDVHERFIFVTLDTKSRDVLSEHWPQIRQFHWPTPCLYKPFSFAEGAYQTIYLFRANLAVALIKRGKSFWMMQQDTFWRRNLFDIGLEQEPDYDLLFDQIGHGNNSKRAEWVNGANFYVRANEHTLVFFEAIAAKLAHWYTPDMGIMIHQCHTWAHPVCKFIPHRIANSWEWMYTEQRDAPHIMQLDCETDGGSKLQQLARFGFYFTQPDGRTCNPAAVVQAQRTMEAGKVDVGGPVRLSWGRLQFKVYWWLVDYILCTPLIGPMMKPYLPLIGYILMVTMA